MMLEFIFTNTGNQAACRTAFLNPPPNKVVDRWVKCRVVGNTITVGDAEILDTQLHDALLNACKLLEVAKCPDTDCHEGVVSRGPLRDNWRPCQWCIETKSLIDEQE